MGRQGRRRRRKADDDGEEYDPAVDARAAAQAKALKEMERNAKAATTRDESFDAVIEKSPRSSNYYALAVYYKGRSQLNRGNARAAAVAFRKVVVETPRSEKHTEARYWLAKSLLRIDKNDTEAQQILAELMQGNGSMASSARDTYNRAFGRKYNKDAPSPKAKKRTRRESESKSKKSAPRTVDFEDSAETLAE